MTRLLCELPHGRDAVRYEIPVGQQVYLKGDKRYCIACAIRTGLHIDRDARVLRLTTDGLRYERPGLKPSFIEDEDPEKPCDGPSKGWNESNPQFMGEETDQSNRIPETNWISTEPTPDDPNAETTRLPLDGFSSEPAAKWLRTQERSKERSYKDRIEGKKIIAEIYGGTKK